MVSEKIVCEQCEVPRKEERRCKKMCCDWSAAQSVHRGETTLCLTDSVATSGAGSVINNHQLLRNDSTRGLKTVD